MDKPWFVSCLSLSAGFYVLALPPRFCWISAAASTASASPIRCRSRNCRFTTSAKRTKRWTPAYAILEHVDDVDLQFSQTNVSLPVAADYRVSFFALSPFPVCGTFVSLLRLAGPCIPVDFFYLFFLLLAPSPMPQVVVLTSQRYCTTAVCCTIVPRIY